MIIYKPSNTDITEGEVVRGIQTGQSFRLDSEQVRPFCSQILQGVGMTQKYADTVVDNLIFADLRGVSSHGISRMKTYSDRARKGYCNVSPNIRILRDKGSSILLDGDNGYGAVVGKTAMELTMERAKEYGCAICSVCNSNHFGAASYYTTMASGNDMIGFCCTNSQPNMAPYGSKEPLIGTNPFSIAIPAGEYPPVVLDIATSVVARGNILNAAKEGKSIPDGWAMDKDGNPTNDAQLALQGSVLPFGGHKGSGIAIAIDAICGILSGAAFGQHIRQLTEEGMRGAEGKGPDVGHLFAAISIAPLQDIGIFKVRMDQMINELKSAEKGTV
jgi:LDH2 family malate/lactate/ureidoglycolate dehydrogenase